MELAREASHRAEAPGGDAGQFLGRAARALPGLPAQA